MRIEPHLWSLWFRVAVLPLTGLLLVACPKTNEPVSATAASACSRSLVAELKTARDRLSRGHPQEARVYLQAIEECRESKESVEFLRLAASVYEELGQLNESWAALYAASSRGGATSEESDELAGRLTGFEDSYCRLVTGSGPNSQPVDVAYQGAVLDDATFELLAEIGRGEGVQLGDGRWGYWLFPGRYQVGGRSRTLLAGQTLDLSRN
ncbi:MAG: hypothetical protein CMP23_14710 [Rickettsiales bacterium]|nr:hypothetical protein [Rickettsiales bacterium]|tara:strand:+ start:3166 stop:3795 length:630 start_codon:yes stop_codon:yes gene_type:complete